MDRRHFLKNGLIGFSALQALQAGLSPLRTGASPLLAGAAGETEPESRYDLAVIGGSDLDKSVRAAMAALGGMSRFVNKADIVLLKPNVSFPNPPEWGSTTHPDVIRTVTQLCMDAGAKRVIAMDYPMRRAQSCLNRSGMSALADGMPDLSFVQLGKDTHFERIEAPKAGQFDSLMVARLLGKADVFINLPSAKAHSATTVSFGIKNLMGLIQHRGPFHSEYDLHIAVAELATVVRPDLTILDAGYALMTNGPQGPGRSEQLNTIVAGIDPVAVDAYGCTLGDWNDRTLSAENVAHIDTAAALGVGLLSVPASAMYHRELG